MSRARVAQLAQGAGALILLAVLLARADRAVLAGLVSSASPVWFAAALVVRSGAALLRELRLWAAIDQGSGDGASGGPPRRPPLAQVVAIGVAGGLLNLVFPARAGDLVGAGMLRSECGLPAASALAVFGLSSFIEALVFGLMMLGLVELRFPDWEAVLGAATALRARAALTQLSVGGAVLAVVLLLTARGLNRRGQAAPSPSVARPLWRRLAEDATRTALRSPSGLLLNAGLAGIQVIGRIAALALLFRALAVPVESLALTAGLVLGVASLSALLVPASLGAGVAAATTLVFAGLGLAPETALAFSALLYVLDTVSTVGLGAWPLWRRLGRLGEWLAAGV